MLDAVQNELGKREVLAQVNPAEEPHETLETILISIDMAGDCFLLSSSSPSRFFLHMLVTDCGQRPLLPDVNWSRWVLPIKNDKSSSSQMICKQTERKHQRCTHFQDAVALHLNSFT